MRASLVAILHAFVSIADVLASNQSGKFKCLATRRSGLHVMHQFCGCSQRGQQTVVSWVDGYDGETVLYYQLGNKSFVATQPLAQSLVNGRNANLQFVESVPQLVSNLCDRIKRLASLTNVTRERRAPTYTRAYTWRRLAQGYLVCRASGFFPRDVNVSWVRDGEVVESGQETVDVVPQRDGTFQVRSVRPLNGGGGTYICQVEHEAIKGKLFIPLERNLAVSNEALIIIGSVMGILGVSAAVVATAIHCWLVHGGKKSNVTPTVGFNKETGLCRTYTCGGSVHSSTSNSSNSSGDSADGLTKSSA